MSLFEDYDKNLECNEVVDNMLRDGFNYSAVVYNEELKLLHHICGYQQKPNKNDLDELATELLNDEVFKISEEALEASSIEVIKTKELYKFNGYIWNDKIGN